MKTPGLQYWNNKFVAYMHDPVDKVFHIPGHEKRAGDIISQFGLNMPNDRFWKLADSMASGFERGQVPSYSKNENENGAVNFLENPIITHPTASDAQLQLELPDELKNLDSGSAAGIINKEVIKAVSDYIGTTDDQTGYSGKFQGDPELFARARFFYTHLGLRFKLAEENVASLGGLWHRIPADSRFPDHSIWQHNALTSAIYSCMELSESEKDIGMMVFSITPVQDFIGRARKLRDFWTGSVLLSWLAFEGIRWVCENLGPDHLLYPSLIDQPLMNEYLKSQWQIDDIMSLNSTRDIASFPNKFLFLVPLNRSEDIAADIRNHIKKEWTALCRRGEEKLTSVLNLSEKGEERDHISRMFERQAHDFWEFTWASVQILTRDNNKDMAAFLPEKVYKKQMDLLGIFNEIIKDKKYFDKSGRGVLYSVTHSLTQSVLAASKTVKQVRRGDEIGEKCHMCGEFEVLHSKKYTGDIKASEYKSNIDDFWNQLRQQWGREADFGGENEKLCSLCLLKRILYRVFEGPGSHWQEHILSSTFEKNSQYPSTTELSLFNYFERKRVNKKERPSIAQSLHDNSDDTLKGKGLKNRDKYYAILLMDGDKMGQLVSGAALASTWKSIMHPDIKNRLTSSNFNWGFKDNWEKIFRDCPQRLLTPSIHAAISEALGDFAVYGVASIVKENHGKLIYAGGDDVCAVLPVDTALKAARKIRDYYSTAFQVISEGSPIRPVSGVWKVERGKLSTNLGKGKVFIDGEEKIVNSISAGILICHHKENLSQMLRNTHGLLDDQAKNSAGRDACAIELRKRSGGSRYFIRKWDDPAWDSFLTIGTAAGQSVKDIESISKSLVYRLEKFRVGVEAVLNREGDGDDLLIAFVKRQLERSSLSQGMEDEFARKISEIIKVKNSDNGFDFVPEGLIVGSFLYGGEKID